MLVLEKKYTLLMERIWKNIKKTFVKWLPKKKKSNIIKYNSFLNSVLDNNMSHESSHIYRYKNK